MTELILGATSGIGKALARQLADEGAHLILAGRDAEELGRLAADLRLRGAASAEAAPVDARDFDAHAAWAEALPAIERAYVFTGLLGDTDAAQTDADRARALIDVNLTGVVSMLTPLVARMRAAGTGALAIVGSVAGDRGRGSNYPYGAPKAGLAAWAAGLRNAAFSDGVHVMLVKPGFVDTAMTYGKPGMFLVARPEDVASAIRRGLARHKDVLYAPWFWRWIMWIIRSIPEPLFKRLSL